MLWSCSRVWCLPWRWAWLLLVWSPLYELVATPSVHITWYVHHDAFTVWLMNSFSMSVKWTLITNVLLVSSVSQTEKTDTLTQLAAISATFHRVSTNLTEHISRRFPEIPGGILKKIQTCLHCFSLLCNVPNLLVCLNIEQKHDMHNNGAVAKIKS